MILKEFEVSLSVKASGKIFVSALHDGQATDEAWEHARKLLKSIGFTMDEVTECDVTLVEPENNTEGAN